MFIFFYQLFLILGRRRNVSLSGSNKRKKVAMPRSSGNFRLPPFQGEFHWGSPKMPKMFEMLGSFHNHDRRWSKLIQDWIDGWPEKWKMRHQRPIIRRHKNVKMKHQRTEGSWYNRSGAIPLNDESWMGMWPWNMSGIQMFQLSLSTNATWTT